MTGDSFRGMLHSRNAISGSLSEKGALSRASVLQGANDQDPIGIDRPAHVGTRPRGCDTARLLSFPKCSILLFDSIEAKNTGGQGCVATFGTAPKLVLDHYDRAGIHAAMNADRALAKGRLDAYRFWREVIEALREMGRRVLVDGERLDRGG